VPWLVQCSFNEEATLAAETKPRFSRAIRKCGGPDSAENQNSICGSTADASVIVPTISKSIDPLEKW